MHVIGHGSIGKRFNIGVSRTMPATSNIQEFSPESHHAHELCYVNQLFAKIPVVSCSVLTSS